MERLRAEGKHFCILSSEMERLRSEGKHFCILSSVFCVLFSSPERMISHANIQNHLKV